MISQALGVFLCGLLAMPARAGEADSNHFLDWSIEQLMNESVTSVAKKETKLSQSPAAIAVVTQEDIRRLGITSLPEALRWVPGMDVGRIDSHSWAISSRGFEGQFANKLLVLVDGRTVYQPGFAGVYWDAQDVVLEDLDRIEVIRGPGATLWGANAVNGVVNIITRSAKDTQGLLVSAAAGTEDQPSVSVRYGGQLDTNLYYRVWVKSFNRDGLVTSSGADAPDAWNSTRAGFRMDWEPSTENRLTLEGEYYYFETGESVTRSMLTPPFSTNLNVNNYNDGGNILGRWTRTFSEGSQLSLQAYYNHVKHSLGGDRDLTDTFDIELQHRFELGDRHDFVWGVGYRLIESDIQGVGNLVWTPQERSLQLFTAFLQDDITLVPERLHLSLGSKLEHNDQTGFEVQPGARLLWTPSQRQTVWGSVSRAVRTPARFERDARLDVAAFQPGPGAPTFDVALLGNPNVKAEELLAYELGYRIEPTKNLSFDVAAFFNAYDNVIQFEPGAPRFEATPAPPHLLLPQNATNALSGSSYGVELAVQFRVSEHWRLAADYSWLHLRFLGASSGFDSPEQQVRLRSYVDLPWNLEFNSAISYVDTLRDQQVPSYVRLDLGLVWRPTKSLEVGVWGQNLLDGRHPEFPADITTLQTEVPRSVLGKMTWRF